MRYTIRLISHTFTYLSATVQHRHFPRQGQITLFIAILSHESIPHKYAFRPCQGGPRILFTLPVLAVPLQKPSPATAPGATVELPAAGSPSSKSNTRPKAIQGSSAEAVQSRPPVDPELRTTKSLPNPAAPKHHPASILLRHRTGRARQVSVRTQEPNPLDCLYLTGLIAQWGVFVVDRAVLSRRPKPYHGYL